MSRRVLVLGLVVVVLMTAAWYFFLISPRNSKIADLNEQIDAAIIEADALRVAAATLRTIQSNDVAYLAAIGQMEAGIPQEAELAVFIEEVTALAEETGVTLQSLAPAEPTAVPDLDVYEISVSLAMEGDYFELLGFLFGLDDMERIVVVESISITAGAGAGVEETPDETTTTTTTAATTTTTTVAGGGSTTTSTTVAGGGTTSTTTSTTIAATTTTSTTIATLGDDDLSIALTVRLFTRTPLLPAPATPAADEGGDEVPEEGLDTEAEGGEGEFGQSEFGINSPDAPANVGAPGEGGK